MVSCGIFCSGQYLLFSARFARVMHQLLVNLRTLHVQFVQEIK